MSHCDIWKLSRAHIPEQVRGFLQDPVTDHTSSEESAQHLDLPTPAGGLELNPGSLSVSTGWQWGLLDVHVGPRPLRFLHSLSFAVTLKAEIFVNVCILYIMTNMKVDIGTQRKGATKSQPESVAVKHSPHQRPRQPAAHSLSITLALIVLLLHHQGDGLHGGLHSSANAQTLPGPAARRPRPLPLPLPAAMETAGPRSPGSGVHQTGTACLPSEKLNRYCTVCIPCSKIEVASLRLMNVSLGPPQRT